VRKIEPSRKINKQRKNSGRAFLLEQLFCVAEEEKEVPFLRGSKPFQFFEIDEF
jgi:hypothetical protein